MEGFSMLDKIKADAKATWDMLEGKLSGIKSPMVRFSVVALVALGLVLLLGSILPTIFAIIIVIVAVIILFRLFDERSEK